MLRYVEHDYNDTILQIIYQYLTLHKTSLAELSSVNGEGTQMNSLTSFTLFLMISYIILGAPFSCNRAEVERYLSSCRVANHFHSSAFMTESYNLRCA